MTTKEFLQLCESGTPQQIIAAIETGADVNSRNGFHDTALMTAASWNKNPEIIAVLLETGAIVNTQNKQGKTTMDRQP